MILNDLELNNSEIPCKICGHPIIEISQIFCIPVFDPYFFTKEPNEVREMVSLIGAHTHRSCWSDFPSRELICCSVVEALKHEFRRAMCLAESNQVIACSTKNDDFEFTPGVLFLPRSSLISRHLFGITMGNPVVRERGKCVEHLVDVLTQKNNFSGFFDKVLMINRDGSDHSMYIQFEQELDNIIKLNFLSPDKDVYAVYFVYQPDIELLKQSISLKAQKVNAFLLNNETTRSDQL